MQYLESLPPVVQAVIVIGLAAFVGIFCHLVLFRIFAALGKRVPRFDWITSERLKLIRPPSRTLLALIFMYASAPLWRMELNDRALAIIDDIFFVIVVLIGAWFLIRTVAFAHSIAASKYKIDIRDNLHNRKVLTNVQIAKRLADIVIIIVAISMILLSFERFQELGAGLLASAGIAGIVLGIAAQKTLGNLLAGFQIAWTQPIRVDDVVIVEGEWGRIEEITLTYAVVCIWDQRRLVVPINHFIEKPIENWTRTSSDLLGTVFLYCDYEVDFDAIREELTRICEESDFWDERLARIHVTNVSEQTVEVRCLVSAADSSSTFELRCEVREKLVRFLKERYPDSLPVIRARMKSESEAA